MSKTAWGKVQCCYCGKGIVGETPVVIHLELPHEATSTMFAHGQCMKDRLHPSVAFLTPAEHQEAHK